MKAPVFFKSNIEVKGSDEKLTANGKS